MGAYATIYFEYPNKFCTYHSEYGLVDSECGRTPDDLPQDSAPF